METQHIKFVRKVAECQNISAAARDLGMTQPALTKIVSRVEDLVGAKLFDRGPRGVLLTPLGELFLKRMERVEHEMDNLKQELRTRKAGVSGTVSLAVGHFWLGRILPAVLSKLNKIAPDIQVRIATGTREELLDRTKTGAADIMLGRIARDIPEGFAGEELADVEMVLAGRAGHPLSALERSVEPGELSEYGWILPPRADPTIRNAFTESGLEPPIATVEAVSRQLIDNLLERTDFLTVFPAIRGRPIGGNLTRIRADWLGWTSSAGVMMVEDRTLLPCCQTFLNVLRAEISNTEQLVPAQKQAGLGRRDAYPCASEAAPKLRTGFDTALPADQIRRISGSLR